MATKSTVAKATPKAAPKATTGKAALERKALAAQSKSEGMRMLFDAGYTVVEVRHVFNAPYGFVYGVADRYGVADKAAKPREPKANTKVAAKATSAKRTTVKPATKITKVASNGVAIKARATKPATSATARVAAKIAAKQAVKPGRPTAARRQANRKPRTASAEHVQA